MILVRYEYHQASCDDNYDYYRKLLKDLASK